MDSKENTEKKDGKGNSTSTDVRPAHQRGLCPTPTEEQMHSLRHYSVYMCICEYSAVLYVVHVHIKLQCTCTDEYKHI